MKFPLQRGPWTTLASKIVYQNPWMTVREDAVTRPDGKPGIYGVANHLLDTPWPKLTITRQRFTELLKASDVNVDALFTMLMDRTPTADKDLPRTGLPLDWERTVSSPFIVNDRYGTRTSTVLLVERNGRTILHERRFESGGIQSGVSRFEFKSADVPEQWFAAEDPDDPMASDPTNDFDTSPE